MSGRREFGDYQTPQYFAYKICRLVKEKYNLKPSFVLEPTCGTGSFLQGSLIFDADEYLGIDINKLYCEECRTNINDSRVEIICSDFFQYDMQELAEKQNILVIGNPPWVNNSTLAGKHNLPAKSNFRKMKGIEALTGESNFDISEAIILRLINHLKAKGLSIAMLCKISVARRLFCEIRREGINFSCFDMFTFDAETVFKADVKACLIFIDMRQEYKQNGKCTVYSLDDPLHTVSLLEYINGKVINASAFCNDNFFGKCAFEWHQGVKHDCAKIMELTETGGNTLHNGLNEVVDIEPEIIFPLVKSSMIKCPVINQFSKHVIVTQKYIRHDTLYIKHSMPLAWEYLNKNIAFFMKRKSIVYRSMPLFSMFGVGEYSYSQYKVAISGFYRKPLFSLLYSLDGRPVMTDDTIYFMCFDSYDEAYTAMIILNTEHVQKFLEAAAFPDAKRIYTKKLLEIIDFSKICDRTKFSMLRHTEETLKLNSYLNENMLNMFCKRINILQG